MNLKRIEELLYILPKKDIEICLDYLEKRDFQSILEIVDSDLYIVEKNRKKEDIPSDYSLSLEELKVELLDYISCLEITEDESYDYY